MNWGNLPFEPGRFAVNVIVDSHVPANTAYMLDSSSLYWDNNDGAMGFKGKPPEVFRYDVHAAYSPAHEMARVLPVYEALVAQAPYWPARAAHLAAYMVQLDAAMERGDAAAPEEPVFAIDKWGEADYRWRVEHGVGSFADVMKCVYEPGESVQDVLYKDWPLLSMLRGNPPPDRVYMAPQTYRALLRELTPRYPFRVVNFGDV